MNHLLGVKELSREAVTGILDRAQHWADRPGERSQALAGAFVANLFFEPSTRTRFSFEVAAKRLGADVLNFSAAASSTQKGESLYDTIKTLEAMGVGCAVIRHAENDALRKLAPRVGLRIINAGEGQREHPTQCLLDLLTMRQHFGGIDGLKVAIIGDIKHSRVARSDMWALAKFDTQVMISGPEKMMISGDEVPANVSIVPIDDAVAKADVVMMLRVQRERHQGPLYAEPTAYHMAYGLTKERERTMQRHAVIMHPAPINRGVEIDSDLVESERSLIQKQVANGVAVRMAVLENVFGGGKETWESCLKTVNM